MHTLTRPGTDRNRLSLAKRHTRRPVVVQKDAFSKTSFSEPQLSIGCHERVLLHTLRGSQQFFVRRFWFKKSTIKNQFATDFRMFCFSKLNYCCTISETAPQRDVLPAAAAIPLLSASRHLPKRRGTTSAIEEFPRIFSR